MLTKQKTLQSNYEQFTTIYTLKKVPMAKLEDLLKALPKNGLKISPKSVSYLKKNCNTWETLYLEKVEKFVLNL